jgi:hypothetical protein
MPVPLARQDRFWGYNRAVMVRLALFLIILACPALAGAKQTGEVRGVVLDARGGEALARVQIQLESTAYQAVTDAQGHFTIPGIEPGDYDLRVSTVGYQLLKKRFTLAPGEVKEFEIILSLDTGRRTETVEVKAGPFEVARQDSPSELTLRGTEAKNLASVLADDPLRSVQSLPGVTSNNDFDSRFSLRGAAFHNTGFYLDDVNLHAPFHMVEGEETSGSLTIFNGDTLESIDLHNGAFPARYSDATAGALDLATREGSREKPRIRATASASNAGFVAEGPLDEPRRGDWLISVRKSYLQYLLNRLSIDSALAFGFFDSQEKFSYDLNSRHHLSLDVVYGTSGLDRSGARARLGKNTATTSDTHYTLLNLAWRYTPSEHFLLTNRAAFMRETFDDFNPDELPLLGGHYDEWVWITKGTWFWSGQADLDFGGSVRRLHEDGFRNRYQFNPTAVLRLDASQGYGLRTGSFVEESWKPVHGRIRLSAGLRWDRHDVDQVDRLSPRVSLAFIPLPSTRLDLGWGRYVEFPDLVNFFSRYGSVHLLPERADHVVAGVEQNLDPRTRVRVEFYQRLDRDLLFRPFLEPRLIGGQVFNPPLDPPLRNALHGTSRGVEVFLQRRSANRLTGWVSYAWGRSRLREDEEGIDFPSDQDQRHTANVYLSYRVRPTVNVSLRALYGSGFPIAGFLRRQGPNYFLSESRNQVREDPYQRTDFRINKAYVHDRWKMTVYGEVVNLFNRRNTVFETFNGYNGATGQAYFSTLRMFPILPSGGIAVEF